jgi:hypothetical protein
MKNNQKNDFHFLDDYNPITPQEERDKIIKEPYENLNSYKSNIDNDEKRKGGFFSVFSFVYWQVE